MSATPTDAIPAAGELVLLCHGAIEVRLSEPLPYRLLPGRDEGSYMAVLADKALAMRLRERLNHGRGTSPSGARKSLERKLLRLILGDKCPRVLASLVASVGPREHDGRAPVTDTIRLAVLAQWLCSQEWRGRVFTEVTLRQEPCYAPEAHAPCIRLDAVFFERRSGYPPRATGIEIKSSRADFRSDGKWEKYVGRVDRLYFATPPGVIRDGELPEGIGLLELRKEPDGSGFFTQRAPALDCEVSELARYDLLYALACMDRFTGHGLELQQRALHAVEAYWQGRKRSRARKTAQL